MMVMKMGVMERVLSRLLFLCVLFVGYTRSAVQQADVQNSLFEAAFQGRCGRGSPCEQLCYELHDGMFECDCQPGYELHRNGYSCLEMNTTDSSLAAVHGPLGPPLAPGADRDEDVLYQKDASFSAELAAGPVPPPAVSFVGDALQAPPQPQPPLAASSTAASTTPTTAPPCTLDCGSGGTCVQPGEGEPAPAGQRCQCPLGRGGPRCETEVELPLDAAEPGIMQQDIVMALADKNPRAPAAGRPASRSGSNSSDIRRLDNGAARTSSGLDAGSRSSQQRRSSSGSSLRSGGSRHARIPARPRRRLFVECVQECCSPLACYLFLVATAIVAILVH